jgi:hypothetical protein
MTADQSWGAAKAAVGTARCPHCLTLLLGASLQNSLYCVTCDDLIHKTEWVLDA